jgi:hypothetical protein
MRSSNARLASSVEMVFRSYLGGDREQVRGHHVEAWCRVIGLRFVKFREVR